MKFDRITQMLVNDAITPQPAILGGIDIRTLNTETPIKIRKQGS